MMITQEEARSICLSMPEIEEGCYRRPDFRVRGRIFAGHYPGTQYFDLKVGLEEQYMLSTERNKFSLPRTGRNAGWITVHIAAIELKEFEELVWKAWRYTAPPRLSLRYS